MVLAVRRALTSFVLLLALFVVFPADAPAQTRKELRVGVAGIPSALDPAASTRRCRPFDRSAGVRHACCLSRRHDRRGSRSRHSLGGVARWSDMDVYGSRRRAVPRRQPGDPIAEVAASFQRILAREGAVWPTLLRGRPGVVKEVRASDAHSVQFLLVQPYAPLLTVLAHPGLGIARMSTASDGTTRFVGSGPYRVVDSAPGRVALEAVAGHWGSPPRAERIVFLEVATDENAEAEFDARALDIWFPAGAASPDDRRAVHPGAPRRISGLSDREGAVLAQAHPQRGRRGARPGRHRCRARVGRGPPAVVPAAGGLGSTRGKPGARWDARDRALAPRGRRAGPRATSRRC